MSLQALALLISERDQVRQVSNVTLVPYSTFIYLSHVKL